MTVVDLVYITHEPLASLELSVQCQCHQWISLLVFGHAPLTVRIQDSLIRTGYRPITRGQVDQIATLIPKHDAGRTFGSGGHMFINCLD